MVQDFCPNEFVERYPGLIERVAEADGAPDIWEYCNGINKRVRKLVDTEIFKQEVRERDVVCQICGNPRCLEVHHIEPLRVLLWRHRVKDTETAKKTPELFDPYNGELLCTGCHRGVHRVMYEMKRAILEAAGIWNVPG